MTEPLQNLCKIVTSYMCSAIIAKNCKYQKDRNHKDHYGFNCMYENGGFCTSKEANQTAELITGRPSENRK